MPHVPARRLSEVARQVVACTRCPRLRKYCLAVAREKVRRFQDQTYWGLPVTGFGDPDARLLIVGLAPAAHGGNRTGRVFTGDSSGDWLFEALHRFGFANQPTSASASDGLTLLGCYVTAAARCAPPGNQPLAVELDRCRPYLVDEIRLLRKVKVVITLGAIGHDAWLQASGWKPRLQPAERPRFGHAREAILPDGITLIPSFHPSRQNTNTGKLTRDMWYAVFKRARQVVG